MCGRQVNLFDVSTVRSCALACQCARIVNIERCSEPNYLKNYSTRIWQRKETCMDTEPMDDMYSMSEVTAASR